MPNKHMNCLFSKVGLGQVIIEKNVLLENGVSYSLIDVLLGCTIKDYDFILYKESFNFLVSLQKTPMLKVLLEWTLKGGNRRPVSFFSCSQCTNSHTSSKINKKEKRQKKIDLWIDAIAIHVLFGEKW